MWEIYREQTCDETLRRGQYGALPAGFTQVVAPRALSEGTTYAVTVGSCDYNQGILHFFVANGGVERE